ncbi:marvel domain-containing protein [Dendryphion nanum]|uniref:Marvel domain-containing protein n=1 Tax=Dendryphion nanum TaxID=256645 RepID=A0A9P9DWJ9_9PLEO|nr:marvel domain-containing protein [Dendryphion nanum]
MSNPIFTFALRGAQLVSAAIVFGLSVNLVQGQVHGGAPVSLGFAAFVGAASLVGALVGLAANWVDALQGIIGLGIDGILTLVNLAGGVLLAVKLKAVNCGNTNSEYMGDHIIPIDVVNAGCSLLKLAANDRKCLEWLDEKLGKYNSRCQQNTAASAFMFITVVILLVSLTLAFLRNKR